MQRKAFFLVVFAAILSGISGLIVKYMEIPASSMAWLRMATPTLIIGIFLLYRNKKLFRAGTKIMLTASFFNVIRMWFFFLTYIYTSISNAIIVLYTWPVFAVILSTIFLKEGVSRRKLMLLSISLAGVIIVYSGHELSMSNNDFLGLTAGILCAFFYACTVIIFKSQSGQYDPFETIFFQNVLGAIVFLPFFIMNKAPRLLDWGLGVTHGVVIGIGMFTAFFFGLRHIKASTASMITYIEVISAMSIGYFVMNDHISNKMVIGASLILIATMFLQKLARVED